MQTAKHFPSLVNHVVSNQLKKAACSASRSFQNSKQPMYELSNVAQGISMIQQNLGSWLLNPPPPNVPLQENKGLIRPY